MRGEEAQEEKAKVKHVTFLSSPQILNLQVHKSQSSNLFAFAACPFPFRLLFDEEEII